jgi:hypothetical protein
MELHLTIPMPVCMRNIRCTVPYTFLFSSVKYGFKAVAHGSTHSLTPWCRILFKKIIVTQLIKKYPAFFMETEGSSPCSQKPATGPYPKPTESNWPHRSLYPCLPKVQLNVILPPTPRWSSQWSLTLGLPNQNPVNTSNLPHACHMSSPPNPS